MNDLEFLRELFKDVRLHIGIGTISQLGLSIDKSTLRVMVTLLPENRQIVATMGWSDVNQISFPVVDDLVLVAFVDGHPEEAFVIKRISTETEGIPAFAQTGNLVAYSRAGKKAYFGSDTKIGIARPNKEPTEPLVLGNVLASGLTAFVNAFLNAAQIGQHPLGPVFLDPTVRTALNNFLTTYINTSSSNILSQIGYTERGTS